MHQDIVKKQLLDLEKGGPQMGVHSKALHLLGRNVLQQSLLVGENVGTNATFIPR